jgi:RecQ family ATP-dependent DNA helicase
MTIHHILSKYWGFSKFRPLQEDIIQSVLDGKDTLALMPTGGGKSLCFQVPALLKPGICIVVSPLIALMKDQVENLKEKGIKAIAIISGMGKREVDIALDNCIYGDIKFLYLSPERLLSELVRVRLRHMPVNLIAIDEAHCISQWGYDFRPSYLHLAELREIHPHIPILALTATASSGGAITYSTKSVESCSVTGATLNLLNTGSCVITVTQAGSSTLAPVSTTATIILTGTIAKPVAPVVSKKIIACIKGKTTKKVSGINPKCPKGYKLKK